MKRLILFGALCLPALLAGCIHNDLPYPVVTINIEAIEAEGLDGAAQINAAQQTVILPLLETTDIRNVHITSVTLTEGGQSSVAFPGTFDLRTPLYTTLSLYQEYGWSIAATQTIERYFRVKKQVGAAEIDPANRTATAYVSRSTDLQNVPVKELKLGPAEITTYSPSLEELSGSSFESVRFVDVTCHGITERWMLYVETSNVKIALRDPDVWKNTATITALVSAGEYASGAALEYRIKGDTEWQAMQESGYDAGILTATIAPEWDTATNPKELTVYKLVPKKGFFAGHTYEFRLLVGGEETETMEYAAPSGQIIPGGDMEGSPSCFTTNNKETETWGSGNARQPMRQAHGQRNAEDSGLRQSILRDIQFPRLYGSRHGGVRTEIQLYGTPFSAESPVSRHGRHRRPKQIQRSARRRGTGHQPDIRLYRGLVGPP